MASSSNLEGEKYEVFISFSGRDVRCGFLSHLVPALKAKQIHVFKDDNMERGKNITQNICRTIEGADLSIVIFSENYPKSEWCLEELHKIHESMKQRKQLVVPVFFEVDPSDVQDLKQNYANIELREWRDALVEISNLSGFDSNNYPDEAELKDAIVKDISKKLSDVCRSYALNSGLFGIDSAIKDVELLLCIESINDVRMVGIWGMGGIGKTTIAREVYNKVKTKFHSHCFVPNVRETLSKNHESTYLRDIIIRKLLGDNDVQMDSLSLIDESIQRRLKLKKALIVLDDVHTCMQLKSVLEDNGLCPSDSFCPGSRILVTSRDLPVLQSVKVKSDVYEVRQLKDLEALRLFSWHSFGQNNPPKEFKNLSEKVVQYAHGVPLALVVLGSELKNRTTKYWMDALGKFKTNSPLEIQKILRISFDGLDQDEKNIFLDIACFYKGSIRSYVEHVLKGFGFHASTGIDRLIEKSLLTEKEEEYADGVTITMHDLVEQMAHEIVVEEKQIHQHQSRIWTTDGMIDALSNNRGIENVEAISSTPWYEKLTSDTVYIDSKAFNQMYKLRFLRINCRPSVCFPKGLKFLPKNIRYLEWSYYPYNSLPSDYDPGKLVQLHMSFSNLEELTWTKPLRYLKHVDLSHNKYLVKIQDLAMAPNLEVLVLACCENLVEIGLSLENLNKLMKLDVCDCTSLHHLSEISSSITNINLSGSGLRQLPSTIGGLTHLKEFWLESCDQLQTLPSSMSRLTSLERIHLSDCFNMVETGFSLQNMTKLKQLLLDSCISLTCLPDQIPSCIEELDLSRIPLRNLPSTIWNLTSLKRLSLWGCRNIDALPENLGSLRSLEYLDTSHTGLTKLPSCIQNLVNLKRLNMSLCKNLYKLPKNFGYLESLEEFNASYTGLREVPLSIRNLKKLVKLKLISCEELESLPYLPSSLEELDVTDCKALGRLSTPFVSPISLFISGCPKLSASAIMGKYLLEAQYRSTKMPDLCIYGSQVPKWMNYRNNNGSSLCVELDNLREYINILFCVVVLSIKHVRYYSPVAIVRDKMGSKHYFRCTRCVLYTSEEMINVFLWNCEVNCKFIDDISFSFMFDGCLFEEDGRYAIKIIKCGVHPIFKKRKRKH